MRSLTLFSLLAVTGSAGWLQISPALAAPPPSQPLAPFSKGTGKLFTELKPAETGFDFVNPLDLKHPLKYLYASSMSTGGVAAGDVDRDGKPDIFCAGGPVPNKLFRQTGPWKFEDVTAAAGVDGGNHWAVGTAMADYDGDGDLDIYVCNYLTPNQLFVNNGDGTFTDEAKHAGLDFADASHTPSWCDYDGDGDLDLYILTNRWYRPEGFPDEQTIEVTADGARILPKWEKYYDAVETQPGRFESQVVGRPDILARNNGDGTFTDVTRAAGIGHRGHGLSVTWFDWDGDSDPDLWIGNDFDDADAIYRNEGDGTFANVTRQVTQCTTWFSMGADFGDVNGDARPDFFIADMAGSNHYKQKTAMGAMGGKNWWIENTVPAQLMRNCLFINSGTGRWIEAAELAGLGRTNWTWAVRLMDLDQDGWNDVYVQCGMSRNFNEKDDKKALEAVPGRTQWDRYEHLPPMKEPNMAWRNEGEMHFAPSSEAWGLDYSGMSYGCAAADLDRDGDLDLVSVRLDEPVALLRNDGTNGRRLLLKLEGKGKNKDGIGAAVTIATKDGRQTRQLIPTRGYLGQDEALVQFGLGLADKVQSMVILWPDGEKQTLADLPADRLYTITQPGKGRGAAPPVKEPTLVSLNGALTACVHREKYYDDFAREPLLPNRMSQWGPCQAWADIDGDGDDDLFLGGSRGNAGKIYLNTKGVMKPLDPNPLHGDFLSEDAGAVFFDGDGDGDPDLFVASGGVECEAGSFTLKDRLYLNDGKAAFTPAPEGTLPGDTESDGPVAAADFDRDGDLDLFIGGRSIPGAYPLPARSRLLVNNAGIFTDRTDALATDLALAGMVTGALWSDADGNGWPDLLVTLEWGPVRLFRNEGGRLAEKTATGISGLSGWWNGIAGRDLDGDGDIDYVVTNFGTNTKYHASMIHPALIYYGDMDGSGKPHIVEAEFEGDVLYPVRGRSCSSQAMPFIKDKFKTYRDFATASLSQIYGQQKLEAVSKFSAACLESGVLRNDGKGSFRFEPLPWPVQAAPGFGVALTELNGDPGPEVVIAQNFLQPQVETPKMCGGLGMILTAGRNGALEPLWPDRSGFESLTDMRSLAVTDLDSDGAADIAVGVNNAPMVSFSARPAAAKRTAWISLKGAKANRTAVGARIAVKTGAFTQTAEVTAGGSYWTQAPPAIPFGLGTSASAEVTVTWPDGATTTHKSVKPGRTVLSRE